MSFTIRVHLSDKLALEPDFKSEIHAGKHGRPTLHTWFKHHPIENGGPGLYIGLNYFDDPVPQLIEPFVVKFTLREIFGLESKKPFGAFGEYHDRTASAQYRNRGESTSLNMAAEKISDLDFLYDVILRGLIKPDRGREYLEKARDAAEHEAPADAPRKSGTCSDFAVEVTPRD